MKASSTARSGRGTPPTNIVFRGSNTWEASITKSASDRHQGRIWTFTKSLFEMFLVLECPDQIIRIDVCRMFQAWSIAMIWDPFYPNLVKIHMGARKNESIVNQWCKRTFAKDYFKGVLFSVWPTGLSLIVGLETHRYNFWSCSMQASISRWTEISSRNSKNA